MTNNISKIEDKYESTAPEVQLGDETQNEMSVEHADKTGRTEPPSTVIESHNLDVFYGDTQALQSIDLEIPAHQVTAMIGPSGCGKSTFLRCINRMNNLIDIARAEGELLFEGTDIYDDDVDPIALRRKIGSMEWDHRRVRNGTADY